VSNKVSVVKCKDYELNNVEKSLRDSLDLLGGIKSFIKPGQRVCLKVNLLQASKPEQAITTHPAVVEAVANLVKEAGANPFIADSPGAGIPYTEEGLQKVYEATGMLELSEHADIELNWDTSATQVSFPEGKMVKLIDVIKPVMAADAIISLPKLKTHMLTTFIGATKNLFGVVPGLSKPGYHVKLADTDKFAEMLLDIIALVKPVLNIMDAVVGMEGDGPGSHGKPREIGLLLSSADAVAMDTVACQIVGINPMKILMLKEAAERRWWDGIPANIEVLGEKIEDVKIADFLFPRNRFPIEGDEPQKSTLFQKIVSKYFLPMGKSALTPRPVPQRSRCTACGECVQVCPTGAMTLKNELAVVNDSKCIRCYCCHENCPEAAIDLKYSRIYRIMQKRGAFGRR
jgi:uncharacterized protein (DUF362 family)/NAD-dependent dihydropyrimidine dehydrogenase PreA subunit